MTHRHAIDATPQAASSIYEWPYVVGVREKGRGRRRRPAGGAKRGRSACTSYNETCVLFFAKKSVLCRADRPAGNKSARRLIYVFFLPKLNDGFGSELGSGEIWNAEKA